VPRAVLSNIAGRRTAAPAVISADAKSEPYRGSATRSKIQSSAALPNSTTGRVAAPAAIRSVPRRRRLGEKTETWPPAR